MIFECCLFNNENIIAKIKLAESSNFVGQLHLTEANRTFRFTPKAWELNIEPNGRLFYHKVYGESEFKGPHLRLHRRSPFVSYSVNPWINERRQRNLACSHILPMDDDVVVLSDVDEIIDQRYWPEILDQVRRHGIVTIGMHFTLYYFNLFSDRFVGPPDFSYKVYVMTGKHFKNMTISSDKLRKLGESGRLSNVVFRIPGIQGFHHSWLGDVEFIQRKLRAYSHGKGDHDGELYLPDGSINQETIRTLLLNRESIFGSSHKLQIRDDISMLQSVESERREELAQFFA
jgi:hypothetical protein